MENIEKFYAADILKEPQRTQHLNGLLAQYLGTGSISGTFNARQEGLRTLRSLLGRDLTEDEQVQYLYHSLHEGWGDAAAVTQTIPSPRREEVLESYLQDFIERGSDRRAMTTAQLLGRQPTLDELKAIVEGAIESGWLPAGDIPYQAIRAMPEPHATEALTSIYETLRKDGDRYGVRISVLEELVRRHPKDVSLRNLLSAAQPRNPADDTPVNPYFTG